MAEVSQCDLYCPRKAYLAAEYHQGVEVTDSSVRKVAMATSLGMHGVAQMIRASTCPERDKPPGEWRPRQKCEDVVKGALLDHPLDESKLSDYERTVLGPYINPEPPKL